MYSFEIIELDDKLWDSYVKSANIFDFYHTSGYHKIEQGEGESAVLLVAKTIKEFVCLPLIIRQINGTDFFDATSVYGYCGPIASEPFNKLNKELIDFFKEYFLKYCNNHKIISIFSRLHPLIKQNLFFNSFGELKDLNKVVTIDLTEPIDIQRQHYSRSYKNQINKLKKKKGYRVEKLSKDRIDIFKDIYFETMDRVGAKEYYYFSDEYLRQLVKNDCFDSEILVAYDNEGHPTSAAIFTITNNIMQYHLGGTKDFALQDAPIKYIMDEARIMGSSSKLKYFNLGGGVGGSDDDSLFRFKSGFSKKFYQFSVWNLVVNEDVYDRLNNEKGIKKEDYPNFFPLYRAKD